MKTQSNKSFGSRFTGAIKSLFSSSPSKVPINPSTYTTPDGQSGWFWEATKSGGNSYFKYENYSSAAYAYEHCPPLSSVVNRKAQALTNGKTWVLNTKDNKEATSQEAMRMRALIAKPNPLQSWRDFEAQGYIYQQLFGFNIILPIRPVGFDDRTETASMWNIPASWIDYDKTKEKFDKDGGVALTQLVVTYNGVTSTLEIADLIIIRDFLPNFHTNAAITLPGSKVEKVDLAINNVIGAYESRNVLINYRGALGILSGDTGSGQYMPVPITKDQRDQLQSDFRRYGLKNKQFQVILTSASLKWQSMGYATKDLMLMEEVEESTKEICHSQNFPPFILGLADTTFNNMNEAKKSLYQDSIIPDANSIYDQLNAWFELYKYEIKLDKDFSHLPILQEDAKAAAERRKANNEARKIEWDNGLITLDEWRISNDDDILPDGAGAFRLNDPRNAKKVPLASIIGVGGVGALITVLTAQGLSPEARQAILEILFGLAPEDASRMSVAPVTPSTPEETAKLLAIYQGREANGQYSNGWLAAWNAVTPGGINLNGNGNH